MTKEYLVSVSWSAVTYNQNNLGSHKSASGQSRVLPAHEQATGKSHESHSLDQEAACFCGASLTQKAPGSIFGSPFWLAHEYATLAGINETHEMGPVVPRSSEELILRATVMACPLESGGQRCNASQLAVMPGPQLSCFPADWWVYALSHNLH